MMFEIQRRQCDTCIYKSSSPLNIKKLEAQIADPMMKGHFKGFRICHHSGSACCRGFWDRHKNDFDAGQLAQRLNWIKEVDHDQLANKVVATNHKSAKLTNHKTDRQNETIHIQRSSVSSDNQTL